jgi:hypothetical protein
VHPSQDPCLDPAAQDVGAAGIPLEPKCEVGLFMGAGTGVKLANYRKSGSRNSLLEGCLQLVFFPVCGRRRIKGLELLWLSSIDFWF